MSWPTNCCIETFTGLGCRMRELHGRLVNAGCCKSLMLRLSAVVSLLFCNAVNSLSRVVLQ